MSSCFILYTNIYEPFWSSTTCSFSCLPLITTYFPNNRRKKASHLCEDADYTCVNLLNSQNICAIHAEACHSLHHHPPVSHLDTVSTAHSTHLLSLTWLHTPVLAHLITQTCCSSPAVMPCIYTPALHSPSCQIVLVFCDGSAFPCFLNALGFCVILYFSILRRFWVFLYPENSCILSILGNLDVVCLIDLWDLSLCFLDLFLSQAD